MEGKECSQHTESQESERKPDALLRKRNVMQLSYFKNVHGCSAGTEEDTQNTDQQECRTTISIRVSFMAAYSLRPEPHTPMSKYIGINAIS